MESLEEKVLQEVKPDCEVVACRFAFPTLNKVDSVGVGIDSVWRFTPVKSDKVRDIVMHKTDATGHDSDDDM